MVGGVLSLLAARLAGAAEEPRSLSYNRDIRPLLADKCFLCHGPDAKSRQAKLRLDQPESALEKKAIVPGKPEESEMVRRIFSGAPDRVMPPLKSHKTLAPAEKNLLRSWIAQGGRYERHWAYLPPAKATVPAGTNAIDYLVRTRLQSRGLHPASPADRRTLARRLYFDLVGLPPRPEAVDEFERDRAPGAYERFVEGLLASAHYGERMAMGWLDVARFADTIGYHSDNPRNIWPYRDYVIAAFNANKPFDQFTREQIAGDRLPNAGLEQRLGSAFNRLLLTTEEGGAQPKDYEYRMLSDRVRAVGAIWLGQTFGCAACHDHKFDPVTARDFYSLGAFFGDIKEPIIGRREEGVPVPSKEQESQWSQLQATAAELERDFLAPHPELSENYAAWLGDQRQALAADRPWTVLTPSALRSTGGAELKLQAKGAVLAQGKQPDRDTYRLTFSNVTVRVAGLRLEALPHDALPGNGPGRAADGNFLVTRVVARAQHPGGESVELGFKWARATFEQRFDSTNSTANSSGAASTIADGGDGEPAGWGVLPEVGRAQQLVVELAEPWVPTNGDSLVVEIRQRSKSAGRTLGYFRLSACADPAVVSGPFLVPPSPVVAELLSATDETGKAERERKLFDHFKTVTPRLATLRQQWAAAKKARDDFEALLPHCLITVTNDTPRTVHILPRGNFLSEEAGEVVTPALPTYLAGAGPGTNAPGLTRLDLANWLVSRQNPLTARVTMNRLWKQFFGAGLSKVMDDLGTQGEYPPNQPLLDWLAAEFMDSGWDVKRMVRLIVNSETYRQVSTPTAEMRARDPENREFACQGRWRLEAELVRDDALSLAGLLTTNIGGPSFKPYQPEGYWENLNFPPRTYEATTGWDQFRRGLYVWWQRSYVHPALLAFDAPTREECAAERIRSNLPQQALVLLNDPSFVEASRAFALRILTEAGADADAAARIKWAWRQALDRDPQAGELAVLTDLLQRLKADYGRDPAAAAALLKVGLSPTPPGVDLAELASWANLARVILNLHETINRI